VKYICVECGREGATATSDLCHGCEVKLAAEDDEDTASPLDDVVWLTA